MDFQDVEDASFFVLGGDIKERQTLRLEFIWDNQ